MSLVLMLPLQVRRDIHCGSTPMIPTMRSLALMCAVLVAFLANDATAQDRDQLRLQAHDLVRSRQRISGITDDEIQLKTAAACQIYEALVLDPANHDYELSDDFTAAVACLIETQRVPEFDAFLEQATRIHADNWRLHVRAASILTRPIRVDWITDDLNRKMDLLISTEGRLLAGQFRRGDDSGELENWADAGSRDRVVAIRLLLSAFHSATNDPNATAFNRADILKQLAAQFREHRYPMRRLDELTDLQNLPEFEFPYRGESQYPSWVPPELAADASGNPIFYDLPATWEAAKSDGERWRWTLNEIARLDPSQHSALDLAWAEMLESQLGTQPDSGRSFSFGRDGNSAASDIETGLSEPPIHQLPDSDWIAMLKTGSKRITLPDEFNPIANINRVLARQDNQRRNALLALASIRFGRRQFPQAAELLKEVLRTFDDGSPQAAPELLNREPIGEYDLKRFRDTIKSSLNQIEKEWVQFDTSTVQVDQNEAKVDLRYRNGSKIAFTVSPIRIEDLLSDVQSWIESKPRGLWYWETHVENVSTMLLHRDHEKYIQAPVATWEMTVMPPANHFDGSQPIKIPMATPGVYWVTARMENGNEDQIVLWKHDISIVRKNVETGTMYYVTDAASGTPVAHARLYFFGFRENWTEHGNGVATTARRIETCDEQGIFIRPFEALDNNMKWMTAARTDDGRTAFEGFGHLWRGLRNQYWNSDHVRVFCITDQPVYRPGKNVRFHLWMQKPGDEVGTVGYGEEMYWLTIRDGREAVVFESSVTSDEWGGIEGQWTVPSHAMPGEYTIEVQKKHFITELRPNNSEVIGSGTFVVEEFRKPEFEVKVDRLKEQVAAGSNVRVVVSARYYFGTPVTDAVVRYNVKRMASETQKFPAAEWDWLYGNGYSWHAEGKDASQNMGDFEATVAEGMGELLPDGTFTFDIDSTKLRHDDHSGFQFRVTAEVTDRSRRTIEGTADLTIAETADQLLLRTDRGYYQAGDRATLFVNALAADGTPLKCQGHAELISDRNESGVLQEDSIESIDFETDDNGFASAPFLIPRTGQFRFSVRVVDPAGNEFSKVKTFFVVGPNEDGRNGKFEPLELIADKPEYHPGDKAIVQINTDKADSAVLLFIRPIHDVCPEPVLVRVPGKSTTFSIDVAESDMPGFFVEALTIADGELHSKVCHLRVPPVEHIAKVDVLPSAALYRPGDEAKVQVRLTDLDGKPFIGTSVISVYDASLEYISESSIPDIRNFYWYRNQYYSAVNSCTLDRDFDLVEPTENSMQRLDWGRSNGWTVGFWMNGGGGFGGGGGGFGFGFGGGGGGFGGGGGGFGGGGGGFGGAGGGMGGGDGGMGGASNSDDPQQKAGSNDSGIIFAKTASRSQFADAAFWTGTAKSNADGLIEVSFKVPDNLTTWKIKAWALGDGTRVGAGVSQIISSKNVIIRPQTPRFFTDTDRITISGVVHNYLDHATSCRVSVEAEGGQIQLPDNAEQLVVIPADGEIRVDWKVNVVASGLAQIRMTALTEAESDVTELSIPVQLYGFLKRESFSRVLSSDSGSTSVQIRVPQQRIEAQSRLEVRWSPSVAGTMLEALPFLIEYPHGCTEQTLNHFLPAVIARQTLLRSGIKLSDIRNQTEKQLPNDPQVSLPGNPVFDEGVLNSYVSVGLDKLVNAQCNDGGWGWFSGADSRAAAHLTAQVVHGLQLASDAEISIPDDALDHGVEWLRSYQEEQLAVLRKANRQETIDTERKPQNAAGPAGVQSATTKSRPDDLDAFVAFVLSHDSDNDEAMIDYLCRDLAGLSIYGRILTGLVLVAEDDQIRLKDVLTNVEQRLEEDKNADIAWLKTPNRVGWNWEDSQVEIMARYLQLLVLSHQEERAGRVVNYLLAHRQNGTWWESTRDTAMVIEAFGDYVWLNGDPVTDAAIEVLIDDVVLKRTAIKAETLFSPDNMLLLSGANVPGGEHRIEIRRTGTNRLYVSVQLTNFTIEDQIMATGTELQVQRRYFRILDDASNAKVRGNQGDDGSSVASTRRRIAFEDSATVNSGDVVEVELEIVAAADYEYLLLEDHKPSGFEPIDRLSGYIEGELHPYRELRDDRVCYYLEHMPAGRHTLRYQLRAENPGDQIVALPAKIEAMYSPELVGNSDEFRLKVAEAIR